MTLQKLLAWPAVKDSASLSLNTIYGDPVKAWLAKHQTKPAWLYFDVCDISGTLQFCTTRGERASYFHLFQWMLKQAIATVIKDLGSDAIVFPSVPNLSNDFRVPFEDQNGPELLFPTTNIPSQFLALIPAEYSPDSAVKQFDSNHLGSAWNKIVEKCRQVKAKEIIEGPEISPDWSEAEKMWVVKWQKMPWMRVDEIFSELSLILGESWKKPEQTTNLERQTEWYTNFLLLIHRFQSLQQTQAFKARGATITSPENSKEGLKPVKSLKSTEKITTQNTALNSAEKFCSILLSTCQSLFLGNWEEKPPLSKSIPKPQPDTGEVLLAIGIKPGKSRLPNTSGYRLETIFKLFHSSCFIDNQNQPEDINELTSAHFPYIGDTISNWIRVSVHLISVKYGGTILSIQDGFIAASIQIERIWECIETLHWLFRGSDNLIDRFPEYFQTGPEGYIQFQPELDGLILRNSQYPNSGICVMPGSGYTLIGNLIFDKKLSSEGNYIQKVLALFNQREQNANFEGGRVLLTELNHKSFYWNFLWSNSFFEFIHLGRKLSLHKEFNSVMASISKIDRRIISCLIQPGSSSNSDNRQIPPDIQKEVSELITKELVKEIDSIKSPVELQTDIEHFSKAIIQYWQEGKFQSLQDYFGPFYTLKAVANIENTQSNPIDYK